MIGQEMLDQMALVKDEMLVPIDHTTDEGWSLLRLGRMKVVDE